MEDGGTAREAEVEASAVKHKYRNLCFFSLKAILLHTCCKTVKNWGIHAVPKYLREIKFAHAYQRIEPKVKNRDEDKNKKWI